MNSIYVFFIFNIIINIIIIIIIIVVVVIITILIIVFDGDVVIIIIKFSILRDIYNFVCIFNFFNWLFNYLKVFIVF